MVSQIKNVLNYLKKLFTNKEEKIIMPYSAIAGRGS
jgi:hypothetical protein